MRNLERIELLKGYCKEEPENPFNYYALALESRESDKTAAADLFDFVVINALFESALFDLKAIVHSQRLKYSAQRRNKSTVFRALNLV